MKRDGGSGLVAFDPMDALEVDVGSVSTAASARPRATVPCDACRPLGWKSGPGDGVVAGERCVLCGGIGVRDLHAFDLQIDTRDAADEPIDDAIEKRDRAGSYHELDRALGDLRSLDRRGHYVLLCAVDMRVRPLPAAADRALTFVVSRMPARIKVPRAVVENADELDAWRKRARGRGTSSRALALRDAEIRRLVRRGAPVQRVAFEFGLSPSQVYRVTTEVPS